MPSFITLGAVAARVRYVEVTCARCDRAWELDLADELADAGPDAPIWQAWEGLNAGCPHRGDVGVYLRCQLKAEVLRGLFGGGSDSKPGVHPAAGVRDAR